MTTGRVPGPEALQRLREWNFRQLPRRRIRSTRSALGFVNAVGCCSTFYRFPEGLPCLWEAVAGRADPRWPRHSHHDRGIGLTWQLKDVLPAGRRVYYGKLLKARPVLVALDLFPAFYRLTRGRDGSRDYGREYDAGRLSHTAKRLMDALVAEHPQYTRSLRASAFMLEPGKTWEFERAMAELQQGLWVVKTEERYEPSFSYRWDLLDGWFPDEVQRARRLSRTDAIDRVLGRYLATAVYSSEALLTRLFHLPHAEISASVTRLARAGSVRVDCTVRGWPGRWLIAGSDI